jgi:excisionase family DNA binding protein
MIASAKQPSLLWTAGEAAEALNISERTLSRITAPHGTLRAIRFGGGKRPILRYRIADVEAWLESKVNESTPESDGTDIASDEFPDDQCDRGSREMTRTGEA